MPKDRTKAEMLAFIDEQASEHAAAMAVVQEYNEALLADAHRESERQSKRAAKLEETVAGLKDDLFAITTEQARLEGYIARANEDDPVPPAPIERGYGDRPRAVASRTWQGGEHAAHKPIGWWNR